MANIAMLLGGMNVSDIPRSSKIKFAVFIVVMAAAIFTLRALFGSHN